MADGGSDAAHGGGQRGRDGTGARVVAGSGAGARGWGRGANRDRVAVGVGGGLHGGVGGARGADSDRHHGVAGSPP